MNATLFNDAVVHLTELPCSTIIECEPDIDTTQTPPFLLKTIGKPLKLYLQAYRNERNGSTRCTVDRISHVTRQVSNKMKAPLTPVKQMVKFQQSATLESPESDQHSIKKAEASSTNTSKAPQHKETANIITEPPTMKITTGSKPHQRGTSEEEPFTVSTSKRHLHMSSGMNITFYTTTFHLYKI